MIDFKVQGLPDLMRGLTQLKGRPLASTTRSVLTDGANRVVVPFLKAEAATAFRHQTTSPWQRPSPRNPNVGKNGGPTKDKIKARGTRKRKNELVAVKIGPTVWHKHFPIKGTKPHIVLARDASGNRASALQIQRINKGPGAYKTPALQQEALHFARVFRYQVWHPGVRWQNTYVTRAAERVRASGLLTGALADALVKKFDDAAKGTSAGRVI